MILENLKDRLQGKAKLGELRSKDWPRVRRRFKKKHPHCAVCGSRRKVQIHHIVPFQFAPDLELEETNLISLCTGGRFKGLNCHLIFGHRGSFQKVNEAVEAVAAEWSVYLDAKQYRLRKAGLT